MEEICALALCEVVCLWENQHSHPLSYTMVPCNQFRDHLAGDP